MTTTEQLFEGIIIILAVMLLAVMLKKLKILETENSRLFSTIILKVTLPALIVLSLAAREIDGTILLFSSLMAAAEILCLLVAYCVAKALKFDRGKTGALMLVSSFGMSAFLGYPIIRLVYPGNTVSMDDAVLISELGVGLLLFILGPIIAIHYGGEKVGLKAVITSVKQFMLSPIFFAIVTGICISLLPIQTTGIVYDAIQKTLQHIGNANFLLVALTIGLLLEFKLNAKIAAFAAIVILIKLIIQPVAAHYLSGIMLSGDEMAAQVLFIEAAMPASILSSVYAKQHNCEPALVANTVFITLLVSLATVPVLFALFF
jgi:predicted permease